MRIRSIGDGSRCSAAVLGAALAAMLGAGLFAGSGARGQELASLDELLRQTRDARASEQAVHLERERRFLDNRDRQAQLLSAAEQALAAEQARGRELGDRFDVNEERLAELARELEDKAGVFGEMFGVVRQTASDAAAVLHNSMISSEFPDREAFANQLAQSRALPTIDELERLWFEMQREMTETGRVARFEAPVIAPDGSASELEIVRVGPFTATSADAFLTYVPESRRFAELTRQPPSRYRRTAAGLGQTLSGYAAAIVDPTRGSLLSVLVQRPGWGETLEYGGIVGYVIIGLAVAGFILGALRLLRLSEMRAAVARQKKQLDRPRDNNPLGRVLMVYHHDPQADKETLQLRLDEAVLKEVPKLEIGLGALKILAAVGPLLGLLGTVTGMIITFQQITLFGTGDPKLMAGGISQALVTTVMGLVMAIPLLLLHSYLSSLSNDLVQLLEEESAGIIAEQAQRGKVAAPAAA